MCFLFWTVFSGERCGPWASCFLFRTIFDMCMMLSTRIMDEIRKFMYLWLDLSNSSWEIPVLSFQDIKSIFFKGLRGRTNWLSNAIANCIIKIRWIWYSGIHNCTALTFGNCIFNTCIRPPVGLEQPLYALETQSEAPLPTQLWVWLMDTLLDSIITIVISLNVLIT